MTFHASMPLLRRVSFAGSAALLAACLASAQSTASQNQAGAPGFSSSTESSSLEFADAAGPNSLFAEPSAPSAGGGSGAAAGQEGGGWKHNAVSHLAFEASGGVNAPAADKQYITWGGQFTGGGGYNLNKHLAVLAEYQFLDDKIPGALIAEAGATGGHAHIWSVTLAPVIDLFPKATNDVYVTGGGGFYRKVTSFTDPEDEEYCEYYGCGVVTENVVVGHFSSNQGGFNIGAGFQRRLGGIYGEGKNRLFAEVRYLDVLTPAVNGITPNGLGVTTVGAGTKVVPVSVGIRF